MLLEAVLLVEVGCELENGEGAKEGTRLRTVRLNDSNLDCCLKYG